MKLFNSDMNNERSRLTEKSLRAADWLLAGSLELAVVVEVFLSSAPTRLTGMTTDEGVFAPNLGLTESDVVDVVGA